MGNFNVHAWRAKARKRMREAEQLDIAIINIMETNGWLWIEKASKREDQVEKFDHWMVNRNGKFCKVDFKLGGVRNDHWEDFQTNGKSHGVTHYAFATKTPKGIILPEVRVITVESFMKKAVRRQNRKSGEYFWVLP